MKKLSLFFIFFLLAITPTFVFPQTISAQECTATNISPSSLTFCAGEFETNTDCLAHGLEIRTPGISAECEQWIPFTECVEDAAGWYTCLDVSGVTAGCEDQQLDYRARRGFLGTTWCMVSIDLTADEGETISNTDTNAFQPDTCPCDISWWANFCAEYPPIRTALGCIPTHPLLFVGQFRDILIGLGGGIAFLLMIVGAFFVLTSQGDPERVKRGKEIFVGALIGLLLMVFSIFILDLIARGILGVFI